MSFSLADLECKEIRLAVRLRGILLERGASPTGEALHYLARARNTYIERVGTATYLSEMLGPVSKTPLHLCTFTYPGKKAERTFSEKEAGTLLDEYLRETGINLWPYAINIPGQAHTRYI